jgi:hypothetical protein
METSKESVDMARWMWIVTLTSAGVLVLSACGGGSTAPLGLSSSDVVTEVAADEAVAGADEVDEDAPQAESSTQPSASPSSITGLEDDEFPVRESEPSIEAQAVEEFAEDQGPPPELEVARSSGKAMSEAQYLALPAYDISWGTSRQVLQDCAKNSGLQGFYVGSSPTCSMTTRSVNGISVPIVEACGYVTGGWQGRSATCREFAATRTQLSDGRWDGGDGSRRWSLAVDTSSDATLDGRLDVTEIDPSSGRQLRLVCGASFDALTVSGPTSCSADTLRPAATSRAWRISIPGGKVTSGLSSLAINSPAVVVREQNGNITVSEVSPGVRARVESGRVVLGAAPLRDWESVPGVVTQPFVELVVDARSSDVSVEGTLRDDMTLVAPPGCPDTFRVAAGERKVVCRVVAEDQGGLFQVNFPQFVVRKGALSRDLPAIIFRMGSGGSLQWRSDAATMAVENIGQGANRVVITPRSASALGLVAQDPNRVTGTLVIDTSAWTQSRVGYIRADVTEGQRAVEECSSAEVGLDNPRPGIYTLCSFPMRPARIDRSIGYDSRRIVVRAPIFGTIQGLRNEQAMSFALTFITGIPRDRSVIVQDLRLSANGLEDPTVTWTGSNAFTIEIKAKVP